MTLRETRPIIPVNSILLGALVPYLLYILLDREGMRLAGALAATGWSAAYLALRFLLKRQWDVFGLIAGLLSGAELLVILISGTAEVFLWSSVVYAVVTAAAFLGSVPLSRPLMQVIAEQSAGIDRFPEALRAEPRYTRCWRIVTLVWGLTALLKAALLASLLLSGIDISVYFAVRLMLGWPMTAARILFSIRFPRFYWRKVAPSTATGRVSAEPAD